MTTTTAKKRRTEPQIIRANTRENSGRFARLNPCERCDRSAGANYYSDERCNDRGIGVVLCGRCCKHTESLSAEAFYAEADTWPLKLTNS